MVILAPVVIGRLVASHVCMQLVLHFIPEVQISQGTKSLSCQTPKISKTSWEAKNPKEKREREMRSGVEIVNVWQMFQIWSQQKNMQGSSSWCKPKRFNHIFWTTCKESQDRSWCNWW